MGFSLLASLSKTPQNLIFLKCSTLNTPSILIRTLAISQEVIKTQTWLLNASGSLSFPHVSFQRSFHVHSVGSQVLSDAHNQNPELCTRKIIEDTEKICSLLSTNSKHGIETLLDQASVEVSPTLVSQVLKRLSNAGVLALSFFKWAEKQQGFKYSTDSYDGLIESLAKIKQFNLIWTLVDDMKRKGLLTKTTFALISRRYARARKVKEAINAFEKMEVFGLKIESSDCNRLIDILCKSRQAEKAQEVFDRMKKKGWGQERDISKLNEVFREMKDEGFEPDVVTYGILVNAYCKARKYDDAKKLFHEMEASNCKPNAYIFCTLINGLGSEKRLNDALEFFERSKASGFAMGVPTYNAVVSAYCWSNKMDDAYKMIEEMRKCGIGPNSRTYDIILHHLIKAGRTTEAYSAFQKMSHIEVVNQRLRVFSGDAGCGIRPPGLMFSNLKQALVDNGKKDTALLLAKKIYNLRRTPLLS
ncbi:hypothetical protein K2173_012756 [Erythroxylum novogranatense]|uniref:Pentatricopeptide repeat-containing protein n=1 Tax=Erythroxylum novogranatense TaxID=1862640 RepID=A0AAV8TTK5_9ROSI|nr:hypothetical protein K2173_012756 [Erythroxylum novogranatense]